MDTEKFKILQAGQVEQLQDEINAHVKNGWALVSFHPVASGGFTFFALMRADPAPRVE